MQRIVPLCAALVLIATGVGFAQQSVRLIEIAVTGIPAGSTVNRYSVQSAGPRSQLVVETTNSGGVVALYAFDIVEGDLVARLVGASNVPSRFHDVEPVRPVVREFAGVRDIATFWPVGGGSSPIANDQFLELVPLDDLRYVELESPQGPEMPAAASPLAIEYVAINPDGTVNSSCTLEPNLVSASRRLTTTGASWIRVHGANFLLAGFYIDGFTGSKAGFLRLYTESFEVAFESAALYQVDPNRIIPPLFVDLTGDGSDEIVLFANRDQGLPITVLQTQAGSGTGTRAIGYNSCGTRMNGEDVLRLQRALRDAGFSVGSYGLDGWYGPDTRGAVIAFQKENGLPATGVANEATWRALGVGE